MSLLVVLAVLISVIHCQDPPCCSLGTGSCRTTCSQLLLGPMARDANIRDEAAVQLDIFCPSQLTVFWQCWNSTMTDMITGANWSGRRCCSQAQSQQCQLSCVTAGSKQQVTETCRESDEIAFFSCLDRQNFGDVCCSSARTPDCLSACEGIFESSSQTPPRDVRELVEEMCSEHSPRVLQCVKNYTQVTPVANPHRYMHCCDKAATNQCRDTCRRTLRTKTIGLEMIDAMHEGGCGPPLPHDKIWQCFLQSSDSVSTEIEVSRIDRMGMDSVKLHCCEKAVNPSCRRLCFKTFSNEWTRLWENFDRECLTQSSEEALAHCINEVEEVCELGCEGLSYCTNFNNRPTELFRSCSSQADDAARYDVSLWAQQGYLGLPGLQLPVQNISQCSPDTWKAVACALQIKPCDRKSHANRICREDCFSLLSQCMDWSHMPPEHTADKLCARLSPDHPDTPCISITPYLSPSSVSTSLVSRDELTTPCRSSPCNSTQVCSVNRNCHRSTCDTFTCTPGCKLGEVSQYLVPVGTLVRIPLAGGQRGCLKICKCSANGIVEQCQPVPCFSLNPCWIGTRKIDHGTWFYMDCNVCSCYAGELTCSKKQCQVSTPGYTSLPCNCPAHYVPVCGRNGNTYPSSCLAKCAGLSSADFQFGPCSEQDVCKPSPCRQGNTCVPARRVCLSLLHKPCLQYQCVNTTACSLNSTPDSLVCDNQGVEHPNICSLLRNGKTLAYRGPCLNNCDSVHTVCAINSETYSSECAARSDHLSVDYLGSCSAVGPIGLLAVARCEDVLCKPLVSANCLGVTPPGACCPVCAGAIRFLFSQKQIDRALYALRGTASSALTVSAILSALERQVHIAECSLSGFLTVELDLFVMIQASLDRSPTQLQLAACVGETEKIASLIGRSSPRMLSELGLSALTTATIVHSHTNNQSNQLDMSTFILVTILTISWFS